MAMFENEVLESDDALVAELALSKTTERRFPEPSEAKGGNALVEPKPGPKGRYKRTESQMIASLNGSPMKESAYVLDRIAKLEDKISELMGAVSQKSREYIIAERPDLAKY